MTVRHLLCCHVSAKSSHELDAVLASMMTAPPTQQTSKAGAGVAGIASSAQCLLQHLVVCVFLRPSVTLGHDVEAGQTDEHHLLFVHDFR